MTPQKIIQKSLTELSEDFQNGSLTSREMTEAFIKSIEDQDKDINAYVTTTFDLAREMADAADSRYENNALLSKIDGIPISLKDVICTNGIKTTASSKILENFVPPYDATVWKKLKAAGAVLLGKVNTDEFTMGGSTETSAFGVTKNPRNLNHVSGGSSGGSAAAVAGNMCAASIGTDTGGSIRLPAHFCGITGLKVSYGRVSRWGTMPMASSLDSVGPMAKTAADCALILEIIAGKDSKDSTTPDQPVLNYTDLIKSNIKGLKVGIPKEYMVEGLSDETVTAVKAAKAILEDLGAEVVEVSLPHSEYALAAYYIIAPSEISANMSRFDGIRFGEAKGENGHEDIYLQTRNSGFGDEVKRRILIGTYALSAGYYDAFYRKAQKVRTLIKQDFDQAFEQVDIILGPVSPSPAFAIGEKTSDPLSMYLEDILTIPANLAGICGVSTPISTASNGLPIGVQLLGPAFKEENVLKVAHNMQQVTQ